VVARHPIAGSGGPPNLVFVARGLFVGQVVASWEQPASLGRDVARDVRVDRRALGPWPAERLDAPRRSKSEEIEETVPTHRRLLGPNEMEPATGEEDERDDDRDRGARVHSTVGHRPPA
jgi:hypothetical protein